MTIITHAIKAPEINIYPVGDVHLGAAEHMGKEWDKFLTKIENEDDSYLIITGDMLNNATRTSVSDIYEERLPPSEQKKVLHDQLWPIKDKILCGVMGNHCGRSVKDVDNDPLYDVFVMLGIGERYRRNMCFMKVRLLNENDNPRGTFTFCTMHGKTPNKRKQFSYSIDGIDCFVSSHTHEPMITNPAKLIVPTKGSKVSVKTFYTVTVPSWMTFGGYGARNMYLPQAQARPQAITCHATSGDVGKWMKIGW